MALLKLKQMSRSSLPFILFHSQPWLSLADPRLWGSRTSAVGHGTARCREVQRDILAPGGLARTGQRSWRPTLKRAFDKLIYLADYKSMSVYGARAPA